MKIHGARKAIRSYSRRSSQEEDDARADNFRCQECETPTRDGRFCYGCLTEQEKVQRETLRGE